MNLTNPNKKVKQETSQGYLSFSDSIVAEVKYLKGHNEVIPHEICHVIDSISSYKQTSLKKEFREIAESYKDGFIDYEKKQYRMLSSAP
jgi:predicted SprT family Zn-dependent metalloprotease